MRERGRLSSAGGRPSIIWRRVHHCFVCVVTITLARLVPDLGAGMGMGTGSGREYQRDWKEKSKAPAREEVIICHPEEPGHGCGSGPAGALIRLQGRRRKCEEKELSATNSRPKYKKKMYKSKKKKAYSCSCYIITIWMTSRRLKAGVVLQDETDESQEDRLALSHLLH